MPKLLLPIAVTALLSAAAMLTPRAEATMAMAPASIQVAVDKPILAAQGRMSCTHRRVCRQGAGCAWRKVCKRF